MDIVSKSSKVPSRILSNEGTYRKDPNNLKREFDVLYKKRMNKTLKNQIK